MDDLRSQRLTSALERAIERREPAELLELLGRSSGLPGPRPNLDLARAMGQAIAARAGKADPLLRAMLASDGEFALIVVTQALGARWLAGVDPRGAEEELQRLGEDPRRNVRTGVVEALRQRLTARGEAAVASFGAWTDGYLQAHLVLDALADRTLLAALPTAAGSEVLARLDEAFALADVSSRAAERSHGVRTLRAALPAQIVAIAARFPPVLDWVAARTKVARPESREVVAAAIAALRKAGLSDADAKRLSLALEASAPPPRDPSRIIKGMRGRGRP